MIFAMIFIISSNLFIMNFNWLKRCSKVIDELEKCFEFLSLKIEEFDENCWVCWEIIKRFILHLAAMWIMIDDRSSNWVSSRSSCRSDIFLFREEVIVKSRKDTKIYTLDPSESETRVRAQSLSICNMNMFKIER